ncbi:MAG: hypothetical protein HY762_00885 [Planctomycetes bacterium]|nr:hypothetical protein [Planctomycetota bacterium]
MELDRIKQKAREMGIAIPRSVTKDELVTAIQQKEGHTACFRLPRPVCRPDGVGTGRKECVEMRCSWRDDCLPRR